MTFRTYSGRYAAGIGGSVVFESAEEVLRIVQIGYEIDFLGRGPLFAIQAVQIAQRGEVGERKTHGVKNRHFLVVCARGRTAGQHLAELGHGEPRLELLDLAFDTALRLKLNNHA